MLEDVYYGFISPEEAKTLHDGRELYFDSETIRERLQRRAELLEAEAMEDDFDEDVEEDEE